MVWGRNNYRKRTGENKYSAVCRSMISYYYDNIMKENRQA